MPSNLAFIQALIGNSADQQRRQMLPRIPGPSPTFAYPVAPIPAMRMPQAQPERTGEAVPPPIPMDQIGQTDPGALPEIPGMGVPAAAAPQQTQMPEITPEEAFAALGDPNRYKKGGKGRNQKWSIAEKIFSALAGWAQHGLAGGVAAATDRNYFNKISDAGQAQRLLPVIEQRQKEATLGRQNRMTDAQIRNLDADNVYQNERLSEFKADRLRKEGDTLSRAATARMNAVTKILTNLPSYKADDPAIKEALGEFKLPITDKDAKKNVRTVQDQRTGAWSAVLTDPVTGKSESRAVLGKDGKPLITTPTVIMQGEYGMFKQNDQQAFTAEQNAQQRAFQAQQADAQRQFQERLEAGKVAARTDFARLKASIGEQQAIQREKAKFMAAYRKLNGVDPQPDAIQAYLNALTGNE